MEGTRLLRLRPLLDLANDEKERLILRKIIPALSPFIRELSDDSGRILFTSNGSTSISSLNELINFAFGLHLPGMVAEPGAIPADTAEFLAAVREARIPGKLLAMYAVRGQMKSLVEEEGELL